MEEIRVFVDPPGEHIKEELEARGWSQRDLAYVLGMTEQQLNPLLSGKHRITPDMARLLGDAFDVPAEFFANLQKQYDLAKAKSPDPAVKLRATLQSAYPIREMIRRGWLEESDPALLELQVTRFFEARSISDIPKFGNDDSIPAFAAKRSHYDDDPAPQIAWLYRVRQIAKDIKCKPYNASKLRNALGRLRSLITDPESIGDVADILAEAGVRLVIVEWLPGMKVDGVCTWLDDDSPVIGLSTLHDRLDNFWFVLRHEIEHVLCGHGKVRAILDNLEDFEANSAANIAAEEDIANEAAANFCIPKEKMDSFFARKEPYIGERDVIGFAARMEVHPAIVVGQVQHRRKLNGHKNPYAFLRKYQIPVRRFVTAKAVTDGWGSVAHAEL
jgi:HTH-type transcriptional regulator / antitoxin HigA